MFLSLFSSSKQTIFEWNICFAAIAIFPSCFLSTSVTWTNRHHILEYPKVTYLYGSVDPPVIPHLGSDRISLKILFKYKMHSHKSSMSLDDIRIYLKKENTLILHGGFFLTIVPYFPFQNPYRYQPMIYGKRKQYQTNPYSEYQHYQTHTIQMSCIVYLKIQYDICDIYRYWPISRTLLFYFSWRELYWSLTMWLSKISVSHTTKLCKIWSVR